MFISDSPAVIEPGRLYLVKEAQQRLRLGEWGWKKMRQAGLLTIYQGKRAYVFADDILAYFSKLRLGGGS